MRPEGHTPGRVPPGYDRGTDVAPTADGSARCGYRRTRDSKPCGNAVFGGRNHRVKQPCVQCRRVAACMRGAHRYSPTGRCVTCDAARPAAVPFARLRAVQVQALAEIARVRA